MNKLWLDFETRSRVSLKVVGVYRYAMHPTTEVICMAYKKSGDKDVSLWVEGEPMPALVQQAIDEGWEFHAHNAGFERLIWKYVCAGKMGWTPVEFEQWRCTAAKAAYAAQPRSLDGLASRFLPADLQKDKEGNKIMMKLSAPTRTVYDEHEVTTTTKTGKVNTKIKKVARPTKEFVYPDDEKSIEMYLKCYEYCKQDVRVEEAIDAYLPKWPEEEIRVWQTNERVNDRGLPVDRLLCAGSAAILDRTLNKLSEKIIAMTDGEITAGTQVQRIKDYVNKRGVNTASLDALSIQTILQGDVDDDVRDVLQLRQSVSGAAAKKYHTALDITTWDDPWAYGMFLYYAATTGRFAGRMLQVQNMKHGTDKTGAYRSCAITQDIDMLRFLYGKDIITTLGVNVRAAIRAPKGYVLVRRDSSQVECRICHWLAGNEKKLVMFRNKIDPYIELAKKVYKKDIKKGDEERQICKHAELGLQYGQGANRFKAQVFEQSDGKITLTDKFAKVIVDIYREDNPLVPRLWNNLDQAALEVVQRGGTRRVGKLLLGLVGKEPNNYLVVRLPSGRCLFYFRPSFEKGEKGMKFVFWGPNGARWEWGGGLLTNNCTQGTARDTLVHYMQLARSKGVDVIMQVHDEIIALAKEEEAEEVDKILEECFDSRLPWMGDDLPLASEGKVFVHYAD